MTRSVPRPRPNRPKGASMRRPVARREAPEQGQILVLFTFMLVVLVLVTGLVVDGGSAFLNRRDAQNSADIGAMAGTKRLADYYTHSTAFKPSDNAYTAIETRMTQNGCTTAVNCTWTAHYVGPRTGSSFQDLGLVGANDSQVPGAVSGQKAMGIRVDVAKVAPTYFLGVIGQSDWNIGTTATAIAGQPAGAPAGQILPIALVQPNTMDEGSIYALTSGMNGPGNFGWLQWNSDNNAAGQLAASLCTPNNPAFTLPAQFPGDPGTTNATDVRGCLQQWVTNQQTVLIPIVLPSNDPNAPAGCSTGAQGNNFHYCITGLAAFVIQSYSQPAVDQINGRFVGTIPYSIGDSVPGGLTGPPATNSQFFFMGLVQ
jgi:Flp pilus assembly protein TadG